jgi:hypothetical protein
LSYAKICQPTCYFAENVTRMRKQSKHVARVSPSFHGRSLPLIDPGNFLKLFPSAGGIK